jgi:hypothetical protein
MTDGYYFCLPRSEVNKEVRKSALIVAGIVTGLAIVTGRDMVSSIIFLTLVHVGMYFLLLRYKYVYVSSLGIRGESPLGSSKSISWSDDLEVRKHNYGISGYLILRLASPRTLRDEAAQRRLALLQGLPQKAQLP